MRADGTRKGNVSRVLQGSALLIVWSSPLPPHPAPPRPQTWWRRNSKPLDARRCNLIETCRWICKLDQKSHRGDFLFKTIFAFLPADHFTAKLSVRMTTGPDFVATNFTFFDCTTYTSCTECVSSSYPCDWCVDGHRCTHDTAENCRNDILVTGVNVSSGNSVTSGRKS